MTKSDANTSAAQEVSVLFRWLTWPTVIITHGSNRKVLCAKKVLKNSNRTVVGTKIVPSFIGKKTPFVSKGSESKRWLPSLSSKTVLTSLWRRTGSQGKSPCWEAAEEDLPAELWSEPQSLSCSSCRETVLWPAPPRGHNHPESNTTASQAKKGHWKEKQSKNVTLKSFILH